MRFCFCFVCITLITTYVLIKAESDDANEQMQNMTRALWPISCLIYGLPVSDDEEVMSDEEFSEIKFILFSKDSSANDQILVLDDFDSVVSSKFIPILPVKMLVHGWRDNSSNAMMQVIKDAYFTRSEPNNVIGVDWGKYADSLNYPVVAQDYVPKVGFILAKFMEFLVRTFLVPVANIQMIGHSLGAHVCGFAGKYLMEFGVGKLPVIVGLDPALPFFQNTPSTRHLDVSDADYVEIIHTATSCKGFDAQIGRADFYPNFNRWRHKQPGCGLDPVWQCSHARAYYFFAESLLEDGRFVSARCKNFDELENEQCDKNEGEANMGGYFLEKKEVSGIYFLKTHEKSPYSLN